jgi:RND superfamily putative drug exporter
MVAVETNGIGEFGQPRERFSAGPLPGRSCDDVTDKDSIPSRAKPRRSFWSRIARLIVWLRFPILLAWIAGTALATAHLPSAFESESGELGSLLPRSSTALEVESKAIETFGTPLLSRTIVIAHQPGGFSPDRITAAGRYIATTDRQEGPGAIRAVPLLDAPGLLAAHRTATTLVVYLYIRPSLGESESQDTAERFASGLKRATGAAATEVTGALPATRAETSVTDTYIVWVELATVLLVIGILAFYFRSVGVPLLGMASVGIAYLCADRVLGWVAQRFGITIPQEADPVIVGLIFGVLTDYLVFFVSGYRQRLEEGSDSLPAVIAVTGELLPVIFTAALMIAGATLTLLISGMSFLAAFGPAMAVAVVVAAAVAMTLVPAALAIFGRALLWPHRPVAADDDRADGAAAGAGARGALIGAAVRFPVLVAILCVLVLGAAATGIGELALGNPVIRGLPESTSARRGYELAATGLGPGVLGPTMVVLEEEGIAAKEGELGRFESSLSEQDGVAGVLGPGAQRLPGGSGVLLAPSGNAARMVLVLDGDPDGARSSAALSNLEEDLPALLERSDLGGATVGVTGDTTIATELTEDTWSAFARVAPAALAVLLLLLWALLRSRTAPLYLVGVSVLVVAAALGLTVYVFQDLLGYGQLAFFVPVASAILLLALGADYNVFLVNRIWREADQTALKPAIRTAGSQAGRAITVAGVILALSFGAVALIPIQSFREIAFAMCVGLLLDTLIARTLLIPALVSHFGRGEAEEKVGTEDAVGGASA